MAFFSAAMTGLTLRRGGGAAFQHFAAVQVVADVGIVTALVGFTGGEDSVLSFLYALVTMYGAMLFGRRGAVGTGVLSSWAYGTLLILTNRGASLESLLAPWAMQTLAILMVGALASALSVELQRTGAELRRSRGDLVRLHDLYRRTVDSIGSGLLTTDSRGTITSLNPEGERITGACAEEVIGLELDRLIPEAQSIVTNEILRGESGDVEPLRRARIAYRNQAGQNLHLGLAGSVLRTEDGEARGHVVIFQDVSVVVEMENALRQRERLAAVGEMAAKIAHEIRNPLAAISGSVQILRADAQTQEDSEPARLMDIVVREADRLNDLIRDFLEYARPRRVAHRSIDPSAVIGDVMRMIQALGVDAVEIRTRVAEDLRVWADPAQLKQILWNLCLNGLQAMPEGGELTVEVGPSASQAPGGPDRSGEDGSEGVEIRVRDTGEGISAEARERLFEPFFTTKPEGTGLGLATVHRIVEGHGGVLSVLSEPGEGAEFCVWLPRSPHASDEEAKDLEEKEEP